jgi:hypothetical protein
MKKLVSQNPVPLSAPLKSAGPLPFPHHTNRLPVKKTSMGEGECGAPAGCVGEGGGGSRPGGAPTSCAHRCVGEVYT